jgi:pullulanase/glycogen debranching enzyme
MDVVYNHVSQYDYNPLKYIDKFYYFRLDEDFSFTSVSGCGNDLKTERPMARRLILDSILHWMRDYHIDGFRFDLATMIDWHTINRIREEAQKVNPRVILIAEPWIPGYDPEGFSRRGWAAWNDQIRNGVKGQNPHDGLGFIFGKWQGNNNKKALERYIMGSLQIHGGQFITQAHSLNYLESHDDYSLGDFIRIGLDEVRVDEKIEIMESHVQLNTRQLKLNKLAALFLFTSQGPLMIHEGQEYARSKVIAPTNAPDPDVGELDHNSYNKDNETNWLNFDHAELNTDLPNYYRGLIRLRKAHAAFRHSEPARYTFFDQTDSLFIVYRLNHDRYDYIVILNGNLSEKRTFELPAGHWDILADHSKASERPIRKVKGKLEIAASSGMILSRESISK